MLSENSVVALYEEHVQAEQGIAELKQQGVDLKSLSIVGKGYHTPEDAVGYYTTSDRMKYWGKNGAFWIGVWGMLFGSAFFVVPGTAPLIAAGPVVEWIVAALEGATIVGGMSAIGAGLYSIGVPKRNIMHYEASLQDGMFMLLVHGTPDEVHRAQHILAAAGIAKPQLHMSSRSKDV